ncbi:MAG: PH domain-containing protein [Candidatus Aenigmatarchaeota archaeon]
MAAPEEYEESGESDDSEDSMPEDVDYAIVGGSGVLRPEAGRDEPNPGGARSRPVRIGDRGITLRTSRLSYLYTYGLALLVLVFLFMAGSRFGLAFTLRPETLAQTANSAVFAMLLAASAFLFAEADIERVMRQYVITNTDVVKTEGILRKRRVIIPYQSVSNVSVYKGVLGRLLGFGDVDVIGFDTEIRMRGIRDPDTFYRIVNNKIARMRGMGAAAVMPAAQVPGGGAERTSMDWRSEQRELESRVRQPAVPASEDKGDSILGFLKRRVRPKPAEAEKETKETAKPRKRKVVRRAKRKPRGRTVQ